MATTDIDGSPLLILGIDDVKIIIKWRDTYYRAVSPRQIAEEADDAHFTLARKFEKFIK